MTQIKLTEFFKIKIKEEFRNVVIDKITYPYQVSNFFQNC
jgi:hypothetical protein